MKIRDKQKKFRLPLGAYVSYLLLASVLLTGVTFSKYIAKSTTVDTARVALFNVDTEGTANTSYDLEAGGTADYSFRVKNLSDVAVSYNLVIENLPSGIRLSVSDGKTYNTMRYLAIGGEQDLTLKFTADSDASDIDSTVRVSVYAEQVN